MLYAAQKAEKYTWSEPGRSAVRTRTRGHKGWGKGPGDS